MSTPTTLSPDELLSTTRAVRRGLDLERPLALESVKECLRLALQAPTGGNRQSWRWIVVADPERRAAVAEVYRTAFRLRHHQALQRLAELPTQERDLLSSGQKLADRLHRVPVLVLPCVELEHAELPTGNQASLWASVLPAAWSYALAARSRGLATCWTTVHLGLEQEMAEVLGLPPTVRQAALIPTAHSLRGSYRPAPRLPLESLLHLDGWEQR
ncbi:nitroreductase [Kitasatospora sp. MAP12-15]|uniref:nitroreductase family protein n=1 Tax=unclassified Kitasatospora TaxID=2633591 RepID=UPI002475099C|nr:nitroreductase family protein [Kitasatospora sp. MAP12-44]MDH6108793.1 nitroreductase [Kitasatospora sp. MAP12-44]